MWLAYVMKSYFNYSLIIVCGLYFNYTKRKFVIIYSHAFQRVIIPLLLQYFDKKELMNHFKKN